MTTDNITMPRAVAEQWEHETESTLDDAALIAEAGRISTQLRNKGHYLAAIVMDRLLKIIAAAPAPQHTSPDPHGAYHSRCAIDHKTYDKYSFVVGYDQGSFDESMRQWKTVEPVGINGLTEAETSASMSVRGLSKPAQGPWKDHDTAKLVNELRDIAITYRDAQQLRECIARTVLTVIAALQSAQSVAAQPLTDDEILTIAHRKATRYTHTAPTTGVMYGFSMTHLLDFVRAIDAENCSYKESAESNAASIVSMSKELQAVKQERDALREQLAEIAATEPVALATDHPNDCAKVGDN